MPECVLIPKGSLTDIHVADECGVGNVYKDAEGNRFRYVQNLEAATALTVGMSCCYDMTLLGANMKHGILSPVTTDLMLFAGIVMAASLTAQYYGWIQIEGYSAQIDVDEPGTTAIAIGASLKLVNALTYPELMTAFATADVMKNFCVALEAVATATPVTATTTNIKGLIHGQ